MPWKKRRSSSRRWNSWIEATIKLTVLAARFCKHPEKVYEYNPETCISYVHRWGSFILNWKNSMKCLWKNNFRLNKALVVVGINIGLTNGSISAFDNGMEGESFFPTFVYRLIFMRKFDRFVVSVDRNGGKKRFVCIGCLVPSAIGLRFFEIKNKIQNQLTISSTVLTIF